MRSVRSSHPTRLIAGIALALAACDGLLVDPAAPVRLPLSLVLVADGALAGPAEAFDAADRIEVRLLQGEELILETSEAFVSGGGDVALPLSVPAELDGEPLTIEVALSIGAEPLFAGSGSITPTTGRTNTAEVALQPIVASIAISPAEVMLDAIDATAQLTGTALFATGDEIPGAAIVFSALSEGVIEVSANGVAVALAEGTAQVEARIGTVSSAITVTVRQTVTEIDFGDAPSSIAVGSAGTFFVTLRDRNGYVVQNRTVQWTSSDPNILQIDASGVATALATGTVTITATADDFSQAITVTVVDPVPIAPTGLAGGARGVSISLAWQDLSDNETSFEVWRRDDAGSTNPFERVATLPANSTRYAENTSSNQQFEYAIQACNAAGCSANSPSTIVATVPAQPVNPSLDIGSDDITLYFMWDDASDWETSFVVERDEFGDGAWVEFDEVPANETYVTDTDFYSYYAYFRVRACNDAGCSGATDPISFYGGSEGTSTLPPVRPIGAKGARR